MGQEIGHSHFRKQDFSNFEARLREETALLEEYFQRHVFDAAHPVGGFELEAWLIDRSGQPLPENERFLTLMDSELVTPELARFNVELNGAPRVLREQGLRAMLADLQQTWDQCGKVAETMDASLLAIGILPTLREQQLVLANMSGMTRYRALNEQVRRLRKGDPLKLDIPGAEALTTWHEDVMLEAAATSFQVHLQMPQALAARAFNAAIILSAPMVAVSANSPYLFGHDLWDETRIPVFEQAVSVCTTDSRQDARVTFGNAYVQHSLMECFVENLERYPVLLPESLDADTAAFSHLRLHNGTIWRWNRPLVGFDDQGRPHLRLEHRVMSAGPSLIDMVANAALFYGLAYMMSRESVAPETCLSFGQSRSNFYSAARHGLRAQLHWVDGAEYTVQTLVLNKLLPLAREGLEELGIAPEDREQFMDIIEQRVSSGRNGSAWQRAYVAKYGRDMRALTAAYQAQQHTGKPVHEWDV